MSHPLWAVADQVSDTRFKCSCNMYKQETFHIHTVSFKIFISSKKLGHCDLLEVYTWDRLKTMLSNKKKWYLYIRNYLKWYETLKYLLKLWWKQNCCYFIISLRALPARYHYVFTHFILSAQRYSIHEAFQNHPKRELPNPPTHYSHPLTLSGICQILFDTCLSPN